VGKSSVADSSAQAGAEVPERLLEQIRSHIVAAFRLTAAD
jgi:hypothetical protein